MISAVLRVLSDSVVNNTHKLNHNGTENTEKKCKQRRFEQRGLNRNGRQDFAPVSHQNSSAVVSLGGKRRAAAAAAGGVRILKRKAGTHHARNVVNLDAVQVLRAEHIDKHPHALLVKHEIAFARLLFDIQAVLETGAAARHDPNAETRILG